MSIFLTHIAISANIPAKEITEEKVFNLIKTREWHQAGSLANKSGNQALLKIVRSEQFLDAGYKENNFEQITSFLLKNPSWPQHYQIRVSGENFIDDKTSLSTIVNWFGIHKPITGKGYKYYYFALAKINPASLKHKELIKEIWYRADFSSLEQEDFYRKYKAILTNDDHIKKIDYNLSMGRITAAKSCYSFISPGYRTSFDAQIALIQKKSAAEKQFKAVPKKYYTPGLIYRYLDARKRNNPDSSLVSSLVTIAGKDKVYSDMIWKIQNYIAREYIEQKKYGDAYKVACKHFASNPGNISDAEFLSGWLALRFLSKPQKALEHFGKFNKIVKTPISKSRGIYWLARAHEATNNHEKAKELYYSAASKYPYTFYGQAAATELNIKKIALTDNLNLDRHKIKKTSKIFNDHMFQATKLVCKYSSNYLCQTYIKSAALKAQNTVNITDFAAMVMESKNIHHMAWLAKYAQHRHIIIKNHTYPAPFKINTNYIETPLVYSIIRQESVFDQYATSSAQAKGLMQLLNSTACDTAKETGDKCITSKLVSDPYYNIKLGSYYLKVLIDLFEGSYILAISSYNGGPHNVNKWIKTYGDPRKAKDFRAVLDWIEVIPFYETRNYVQRVLENLQIYRSILNHDRQFKLKKDLLSGNKP